MQRLVSAAAVTMLLVGAAASTAALAQRQTRPQQQQQQPQPSTTPQPRVDRVFPVGASWTAVQLNGRPLTGERPTLIVDDQLRGRGFGGCNTYSATTYPLADQGFAVGPVAVTRRACPQAMMALERSFLVALRGARKWELVDGRLVLSGVAGELRFERSL